MGLYPNYDAIQQYKVVQSNKQTIEHEFDTKDKLVQYLYDTPNALDIWDVYAYLPVFSTLGLNPVNNVPASRMWFPINNDMLEEWGFTP